VKHTQGFTLIEVLVAIALLAAAVTLSYRGLSAVIDNSGHLNERVDEARELDRLFANMERDLLHRLPAGVRNAALTGGNASGTVSFALLTQVADERGGWVSMMRRYEWDSARQRLELVSLPDPPPGKDTPPTREMLFEKVDAMQLRFLDNERNWRDAWAGTPYPRAVEVSLQLGPTQARRIFRVP
jgi:general secretion pathway protein J